MRRIIAWLLERAFHWYGDRVVILRARAESWDGVVAVRNAQGWAYARGLAEVSARQAWRRHARAKRKLQAVVAQLEAWR